MTHQESSIKVYYTKNYALFSRITGNRQVSNAKVRKIENDILHGLDVLRYCPILVKEVGNKLEIIDGQHRFQVAVNLRSKVWYILVEEFELHQIAKINSNTDKWKTKDFIDCYVKQGNQHYIELKDFLETYRFPFSTSLELLSNGAGNLKNCGSKDTTATAFRKGRFEVKCKTEAVRFAEACKLFEAFPGWRTRPFILAINTVLNAKKADFIELVDKFKGDPKAITICSSPKEYLTQLESVYNFRSRVRKVLY